MFWIAFACENEVDILQKPYDSKLSIQCLITPGAFPKLYLNSTMPFLDPALTNRQMFVDNAEIEITSDQEVILMKPDSLFDKFYGKYTYFYIGDKEIEANTRYNLEIRHNGSIYSATSTTDRVSVQLDSVTFVDEFYDIFGEHEGVVFHFKDLPGKGHYYRYEMHRVIDSTTYGIGRIKSPYLKGDEKAFVTEIGRSVYSDDSFDGSNFSFVIEPVFKHKEGDTTYVFLHNCDEHTYQFYREMDRQKLTQKNPFVEPVFFSTEQFNDAIGVFGSYALSDSVLFIYPD